MIDLRELIIEREREGEKTSVRPSSVKEWRSVAHESKFIRFSLATTNLLYNNSTSNCM